MSLFETRRIASKPELIRSVSYPYQQHGRVDRRVEVPKYKTSGKRLVIAMVIAPLLAITVFTLFKADGSKGSVAEEDNVAAAAVEPEPVKSLDYTDMSARINGVIAANPGMDIGVATVDLATGDTNTYGVKEVFVAASTAKLLTAIAYLHDVEQGQHTLTEKVGTRTAQTAMEAMIVDSDNEAWYDFNNVTLSHEEMATYADRIGFTDYDPDRNTATATSLATLLGNLYQKRLLDEAHTNLLLSFMERAKEVQYIADTVPAGTKVYHKPGYLTDRMHDAAIVDDGKRPYVLVIFTKSRTKVYDSAAGATVFTQVASATYDTFLK